MSPTPTLSLTIDIEIAMYDAIAHTSNPMLISPRTRSALKAIWVPALLCSLPLSIVLSGDSSRKEPSLHTLLEDAIKAFLFWLQSPSLQKRISLRWPLKPLTRTATHKRYETLEDEASYWATAERLQAQLFPYDARCSKTSAKTRSDDSSHPTRQILYYTPRLPPAYRERNESVKDTEESLVSAKSVMKWHWLVFPDRIHPPALQALRRVKRLSPKDHREIRRIGRLARASKIKAAAKEGNSPVNNGVYANMWRKWLDNKSSDVVISFEEE